MGLDYITSYDYLERIVQSNKENYEIFQKLHKFKIFNDPRYVTYIKNEQIINNFDLWCFGRDYMYNTFHDVDKSLMYRTFDYQTINQNKYFVNIEKIDKKINEYSLLFLDKYYEKISFVSDSNILEGCNLYEIEKILIASNNNHRYSKAIFFPYDSNSNLMLIGVVLPNTKEKISFYITFY